METAILKLTVTVLFALSSYCTDLPAAFSVKSIFQAEPAFPICQYDGSPGQNMIAEARVGLSGIETRGKLEHHHQTESEQDSAEFE